MRVLYITGEFPPMQGGVGDCTNEIAKALAKLVSQVCVVTSGKAEGGNATPDQSSVVVKPIIKEWGRSSLGVIARTIREFSPSIVHTQLQPAAFDLRAAIYFLPSYLSLKIPSVKTVVTFHDLRPPYLFPKAGPLRDWVTRFLARSSDAVIATNEEDYSRLASWKLKQLSLIPIGSNISTTLPSNYNRETWRARLRVAQNETLVCYFGFLNESKGGMTLMRALALVPNSKLLMIGGQVGASDPTNIAYLARVKALVTELGLSNRVIWTDYTPPEIVTANFVASDICVLPYRNAASYRRGTLMAALAHGMAIVTTRSSPQARAIHPLRSPIRYSIRFAQDLRAQGLRASGIFDESPLPQLRDGENCLLVQPDDPRALADAIDRAAASPELRAKIGAGARELAQHFTWDKIAQQHLDLYQRMIKNK